MSQRTADQPVGDDVLVNPRNEKVHKILIDSITRCGTCSNRLDKQPAREALNDSETEQCGVCFGSPVNDSHCPTLSNYGTSRFRERQYGNLKGFAATQPCQNCFREDGEVVEPDDDETILVIGSKKGRRVHRIPDGWGEGE